MIVILITSSSSEAYLRGQLLLICLVNKANLSGECLRIKFIWTSFSASLPPYCSRQRRRGRQIDYTIHSSEQNFEGLIGVFSLVKKLENHKLRIEMCHVIFETKKIIQNI